jgi:hypothetical protein
LVAHCALLVQALPNGRPVQVAVTGSQIPLAHWALPLQDEPAGSAVQMLLTHRGAEAPHWASSMQGEPGPPPATQVPAEQVSAAPQA